MENAACRGALQSTLDLGHDRHAGAAVHTPGYLLLFILYVVWQSWAVARNREKREFWQAQFPVANRRTATARIGFVLLLGLTMVAVYKLIYWLASPGELPYHGNPLTFFALNVIGFSLYFAMRDLLSSASGIVDVIRKKARMVFMFATIGLTALGVVALKMVNEGAALPFSPRPIADFLIGRGAAHGGNGLLTFLAISVVLALLSVVTFSYRRSFLER